MFFVFGGFLFSPPLEKPPEPAEAKKLRDCLPRKGVVFVLYVISLCFPKGETTAIFFRGLFLDGLRARNLLVACCVCWLRGFALFVFHSLFAVF